MVCVGSLGSRRPTLSTSLHSPTIGRIARTASLLFIILTVLAARGDSQQSYQDTEYSKDSELYNTIPPHHRTHHSASHHHHHHHSKHFKHSSRGSRHSSKLPSRALPNNRGDYQDPYFRNEGTSFGSLGDTFDSILNDKFNKVDDPQFESKFVRKIPNVLDLNIYEVSNDAGNTDSLHSKSVGKSNRVGVFDEIQPNELFLNIDEPSVPHFTDQLKSDTHAGVEKVNTDKRSGHRRKHHQHSTKPKVYEDCSSSPKSDRCRVSPSLQSKGTSLDEPAHHLRKHRGEKQRTRNHERRSHNLQKDPLGTFSAQDEMKDSFIDNRSRRYLEENRYLPVFQETGYSGSVDEDVSVGTSVLSVYATDDDVNSMGIIEYLTDDDRFSVDEGGVVSTNRQLDYEGSGGKYTFHVFARNPGTPSNTWASVPVTLRVRNTREPPEFDSDNYRFSISEFSKENEYVGRVVAWDPEQGPIRYRIISLDPPNVFKVDPITGIITVGDRSSASGWTYFFRAVASDNDGSSSDVPVTVDIVDENTHAPRFINCENYQDFRIPENQSAPYNVIMVEATDEDHGVHGKVTYSLLSDVTDFEIDSRTGQIYTTKALDRDLGTKEYYITVLAGDGGEPSLEGSCSFEVILDDVNDNAPVFDQEKFSQDIPVDSETDMQLLRVTASDVDTGLNAQLTYSISATEGYFIIEPTTGYIKLLKPLEPGMANVKTFHLIATATDSGTPPLSVSVEVKIIVVSSDQMAPSIVERDPSPEVFEDARVGDAVAQLCAKSNTDNPNEVFFTLIAGNTPSMNGEGTFDIRKDTSGEDTSCPPFTVGASIYVAVANLNFEEITSYKLIVQVSNMNARIDHAITVRVKDVNDEVPLLQHPYSGFISENSDANSLIMTVTAIDKDVSPEFRQLTFAFSSEAREDIINKFRIDPNNGQLWAQQSLDREQRKTYGIPIAVTDGAPGHERSNMYWIYINDVNDEPPRFNRQLGNYSVVIPEDLEVGKNTGIMLKVDDLDEINDFSYQIVSGNEADKFAINQKTGEITVNKQLDYDSPVNDRSFKMSVTVSDGRNYDTTDIVITVGNVNDQRPVFRPDYYNITVTENTECDVKKIQVVAYDPDLPPELDQNIRYSLPVEQSKNFSLDATTGYLYVKGCLDREASHGGVEKVNPRAYDAGGRGINAEPGVIEITILDVNDNHPYIKIPDGSRAKVRENLPPENIPPIPILLDDKDSPVNGCPCTLRFDPNTDPIIPQLFAVDTSPEPSQYNLRVLQQLDRESQKFYNIPFQTEDSKGVSGIRFLTIEVDDVNDSPMSNGESRITVYNFEGKFPNIIIGTVYVTDADDHDIDDKTFEIDPNTSGEAERRFIVDKNSGNITMLAGTPPSVYTLVVKVIDHKRKEEALGTMEITVLNLPEEAVRQSGSFLVTKESASSFIQKDSSGSSLFSRTKTELGALYGVEPENVDVFSLTDISGGVIVRFNCHGSPYFTQSRLNGLLLQNKAKIESRINADIAVVNTDRCLYEEKSPCSNSSCSMTLRINSTHPDVIMNEDATVVGVQVDEYYACTCFDYVQSGSPSECPCLNGGQCRDPSDPRACTCPDDRNYGPNCELLTARLLDGFAWFNPLGTCETSKLSITFETNVASDGILIYNGPIISKPYEDYPRDFVYMYLRNRKVVAYLDLGSGTMVLSVSIGKDVTEDTFTASISWNNDRVDLDVRNCLGSNATNPTPTGFCSATRRLSGDSPSFLFNTGSPLQLGGLAPMPNFATLAQSYGWSQLPETVRGLSGCVKKLQFNNHIYDMNSTDYYAENKYYQTCDVIISSPIVKLGAESIAIIVTSLLILLLLLLLLLLLARRSKRQPSYPENLQFVNETMGPSNVEGFEEKDATRFDLNMLRVTPDGQLITEDKPARSLPDVAHADLTSKAPLATLGEGLCIGDYIGDNLKKVDRDLETMDSVRHYCYEGDQMSIASLSSLGSSSTVDDVQEFKDLNEWGPKFERLNSMYGNGGQQQPQQQTGNTEDDSEYEFPTLPKDAARKMRRARFNPGKIEPIYPGAARIYSGTIPGYGSPARDEGNIYQRMRDASKSEQPGGVPYHETVNPLADVYEEPGTGMESWC